MKQELVKSWRHERRKLRIRRVLTGTAERPRLAVNRTLKHISAQIIDDLSGRTLCAISSDGKELKGQVAYGGNVAAAKVVGKALGAKAVQLGIQQVCFDRRGRRFHGRVKALADAAREAGLKF
jgi:large subunit ribosomal protein L18